MTKVSSSATVYMRFLPLVVGVIANIFALNGHRISWGEVIGINMGYLVFMFMVGLYAWRLWDVDADGEKVIVTRFNTAIEFELHEIQNIEIVPNVIFRSGRPFVKIILREKVDGKKEFRYYPAIGDLDDKLLLDPWKQLRRDKAQESLKRRGVKRR